VEDWRGAIDFLVNDKEIGQVADTSRLGLWGSSLSGGHVIVTAATTSHQSKIKAVVSQVLLYFTVFVSYLLLKFRLLFWTP